MIRPGALGDAIVTVPALESLAAAGARVAAVGHGAFRLAADCGLAADSIAFDDARLLRLFAEGGACELFAGFELAIAYTRGADPLLAENLRRSGVGRVVCWPASPEAGVHIADHLLGALDAAGIAPATRRPSLPPQDGWVESARAWLAASGVRGAFVAVHPGSGGRAKRWPAERFAELCRALPCRAVWLLGPAEAEDVEAIELGRSVGVVARELPLATLAGLLATCNAYVGNDSGVTHLAAAVGAPTVAVFGPTDPAVWAPRGRQVEVVGGPQWPSAAQVAATLRPFLSPAAPR